MAYILKTDSDWGGPHICHKTLDRLAGYVNDGVLQTVVDQVFTSDDAEKAIAHICSAKAIGGTIITFRSWTNPNEHFVWIDQIRAFAAILHQNEHLLDKLQNPTQRFQFNSDKVLFSCSFLFFECCDNPKLKLYKSSNYQNSCLFEFYIRDLQYLRDQPSWKILNYLQRFLAFERLCWINGNIEIISCEERVDCL